MSIILDSYFQAVNNSVFIAVFAENLSCYCVLPVIIMPPVIWDDASDRISLPLK